MHLLLQTNINYHWPQCQHICSVSLQYYPPFNFSFDLYQLLRKINIRVFSLSFSFFSCKILQYVKQLIWLSAVGVMPGSDYKIFLSIKMFVCQIRWLKSNKFLSYCGQETWQTTHCSQINHRLQFTLCVMSPERNGSLLTTATSDKPLWEVKKKSNTLVFLSWDHEAFWMQCQLSSIMSHCKIKW